MEMKKLFLLCKIYKKISIIITILVVLCLLYVFWGENTLFTFPFLLFALIIIFLGDFLNVYLAYKYDIFILNNFFIDPISLFTKDYKWFIVFRDRYALQISVWELIKSLNAMAIIIVIISLTYYKFDLVLFQVLLVVMLIIFLVSEYKIRSLFYNVTHQAYFLEEVNVPKK